MIAWVVVLIAGIATFLIRFSFIALFGRVSVPAPLERSLKYIAPSVLAALAVPAIIAPDGSIDPLSVFVPAAILGGLAAWRTRSIGAAIVVGMPALWLFQWLVG